jgi:hypothetical protein
MNGLSKYIGNSVFSQILQILLLIAFVGLGSHFMITYFKKNLPLPNIRVLEERVRLKKKV